MIAPIFVGAILGNLDNDIRDFFGSHEPIIVPFMAFTLGQNINLRSVLTAGLPGVVLGIAVFIVTASFWIIADWLLADRALSFERPQAPPENSAAVPSAVAMADPNYVRYRAEAATVQVAVRLSPRS